MGTWLPGHRFLHRYSLLVQHNLKPKETTGLWPKWPHNLQDRSRTGACHSFAPPDTPKKLLRLSWRQTNWVLRVFTVTHQSLQGAWDSTSTCPQYPQAWQTSGLSEEASAKTNPNVPTNTSTSARGSHVLTVGKGRGFHSVCYA